MDKAFVLMLRCSSGELWYQSRQNLVEEVEALVRNLSSTLGNLVGESARRRAGSIMRKWSADSRRPGVRMLESARLL